MIAPSEGEPHEFSSRPYTRPLYHSTSAVAQTVPSSRLSRGPIILLTVRSRAFPVLVGLPFLYFLWFGRLSNLEVDRMPDSLKNLDDDLYMAGPPICSGVDTRNSQTKSLPSRSQEQHGIFALLDTLVRAAS